MNAPIIRIGLRFSSSHFSAEAEIVAVSEKDNICDVMLTPSDGHAWIEEGWNLQHTKWGFESNEYTEIKPNTVNINII